MSQSVNSSAAALAKAFGASTSQKPRARPNQSSSNKPLGCSQPPNGHQFLLGCTNAPTSLTNLAQLSGINLQSTTSSLSLPSIVPMPSSSGSMAPKPFETTAAPTKATKQQRAQKPRQQKQKSTYNITGMPSMSLDTLISDSDTNYDWLNTGTSHLPISKHLSQQLQSQQQQKTNSMRNNKRNNNYRMSANKLPPSSLTSHLYPPSSSSLTNNQTLQLNDLHVISVSEGLSLSVNAVTHPQQHQPCSHLPPSTVNRNSINNDMMMIERPNTLDYKVPINEPYVNVDGDSNNISLVKLMAILNNPALTITPVVNPPPSYNTLINQSTLNSSYSPQTTLSLVDDRHPGSSYYDNSYGSDLNKRTTSNERSRVPQSTANLQLVDAANHTKMNNKNRAPLNSTIGINHSSQLTQIIGEQQKSAGWLLNSSAETQSTYDKIQSDISRGPLSKTYQQFSVPSLHNDEDSLSQDHLEDPLLVSDPSRNSNMQEPKDDFNQSSVSVQLLKHIADQTKDNNEWKPILEHEQELTVEPEYMLGIPPNLQRLTWAAKTTEKIVTVSSDFKPTKSQKQHIKTSPSRLYIPLKQSSAKDRRVDFFLEELKMSPVKIQTLGEKEVFVSEYHDMLERLMSNTPTRKFTGPMPEPDEIFINRSKRVMSRIDVMLERKKKRRFERIMSKSELKTSSFEVQCAESEDEWSGVEDDPEYSTVIKTQLPLREAETTEKRDHLLGVGLVSRTSRNKILVNQCEKRLQIFSPLCNETPKVSDNVKRLVNTLIKTDGIDVEMRVDSDIKKNDVPILEGLNRNSSRLKMNYMNTIGLEKRSKRTTLYKIKQYMNVTPKTPLDKMKSPMQSKPKLESVKQTQTSVDVKIIDTNNGFPSEKLLYTTCGEALQLPSKNEYMKSLGLMVS